MNPLLGLLVCAGYAVLFLLVVLGIAVVVLGVKTALEMPADLNDVEDDEQ